MNKFNLKHIKFKNQPFSIYFAWFLALIAVIYLGLLLVGVITYIFGDTTVAELKEYLKTAFWASLASLSLHIHTKVKAERKRQKQLKKQAEQEKQQNSN